MDKGKQSRTIFVALMATAVVTLMLGLSQTQVSSAANESTNDSYVFAEGISPQATFQFREAEVTYEFQAFTTVNSLFSNVGNFQTKQVSPEFTLQRIVGNTPYLHEAVDQTYNYGGKQTLQDYPYKQFDVRVDLLQLGEPIRTFKYKDCSIANYKITSEFDKEEGYTTGGKTGFALLETYSFQCNGFEPIAKTYDTMKSDRIK